MIHVIRSVFQYIHYIMQVEYYTELNQPFQVDS